MPPNPFLVIDTALDACSVGIFETGNDDEPLSLWQDTRHMARGQQESIGPMVMDAFEAARLKPRDLSRIIVTLGPGSFTGLRIGLAFAKGLAEGAGIPLAGIGTLHALASLNSLCHTARAAVLDGGRGQYYLQVFDRERVLSEPMVLNINDKDNLNYKLDSLPAGCGLTGPAAEAFAAHLGTIMPVIPQSAPDVTAMAWLGIRIKPPFTQTPLYLRDADAKPSTKPTLQI